MFQQQLTTSVAMAILGLKIFCLGSLHSNPLHRLELISFRMTPGTKCFQDNTFFLFNGLFYGFFAFHTTAWTGDD